MSDKCVMLNESNFDEVLTANDLVLVDFWANWCGPCKMLAPIVEEIAADYDGKMVVGKVDVDESPTLAERFGILSIPALFIFKDGEVKEKLIGFRQKAQIAAAIDNIM